ncbi:aminoglycoside phosphotransferase (APT) family kinase protein [Novosphingobium sp. 1529]|uniref:phosphotransferase family protein n=1 Tax=Novosphingobium sp. 1529 TaxID=3156424 RepID=UPI001494C829
MTTATPDAILATQLDAVTARLGLGTTVPGSLVRLTGGASYETWSFDAHDGATAHPLILRRVPADRPAASEQVGPETEARLFIAARAHGVPEPRIHHILTEADAMGQGFIAERVAGETLARKILRDPRFAPARGRLAWQCGEILARIHAIPLAQLPPLDTAFAPQRMAALEADYRGLQVDRPVFELAFRWLRDHAPPVLSRPVLVHGDFRNGNLIIDETGIRTVLDWELAHLGDPLEDLGWLTVNSWRFGQRDLPAGGFGTVAQLIDGYHSGGGPRVDPQAVLYWRVMGSLSWGIKCHQMALPVAQGAALSVERAMIGRRVSECELDLLDMLGKGATQ